MEEKKILDYSGLETVVKNINRKINGIKPETASGYPKEIISPGEPSPTELSLNEYWIIEN